MCSRSASCVCVCEVPPHVLCVFLSCVGDDGTLRIGPRISFRSQSGFRSFATHEVLIVEPIKLLQENECQDGVWTQTSIIGGEALPQGEDSLVPHHFHYHVDCVLVWWDLAGCHLHVLNSETNIT